MSLIQRGDSLKILETVKRTVLFKPLKKLEMSGGADQQERDTWLLYRWVELRDGLDGQGPSMTRTENNYN